MAKEIHVPFIQYVVCIIFAHISMCTAFDVIFNTVERRVQTINICSRNSRAV